MQIGDGQVYGLFWFQTQQPVVSEITITSNHNLLLWLEVINMTKNDYM